MVRGIDLSDEKACAAVQYMPKILEFTFQGLDKLEEAKPDRPYKYMAEYFLAEDTRLLKEEKLEAALSKIVDKPGNEGSKLKVDDLKAGLANEESGIRHTTLKVLAQLGDEADAFLPEIVSRLQDEHWVVRRAAVQMLGQLSKLGTHSETLAAEAAKCLHDQDANVRLAAVQVMTKLGEHCKPFAADVAKCLGDRDEEVRLAALKILGAIGEHAVPFSSQIVKRLEDQDSDVRQVADQVLKKLKDQGHLQTEADPEAAKAEGLVADLDNPTAGVRQSALRTLGQLGRHAAPFASKIAARMEDEAWVVRRAAVQALVQLKKYSPPVVADIAKLLEDNDPSVRLCAVRALMQLDAAPFAADIANLLQDRDDELRQAVLNALSQLGQHAVPFVPEIAEHLEDKDDDVRGAAHKAMAQLTPIFTPFVATRLEDPDPNVRQGALAGLGQLGGLPVVKLASEIAKCLEDPDETVRQAASSVFEELSEEHKTMLSPQIKHVVYGIDILAEALERNVELLPDLHIQVMENHRSLLHQQKDTLDWDPTSEHGDNFGVLLWPSATMAAQAVAGWIRSQSPDKLSSLRVLEIGAGCGLSSLVAAKLGCQALATDFQWQALQLVKEGARRQGLNVETELLDLCDIDGKPLPKADLMVGSDLLYNYQMAVPLAKRIAEARRAGMHVLITDPGRVQRIQLALIEELQKLLPDTPGLGFTKTCKDSGAPDNANQGEAVHILQLPMRSGA